MESTDIQQVIETGGRVFRDEADLEAWETYGGSEEDADY